MATKWKLLLLLINKLIDFQHLSFLNYLFGISPAFFENRYIFNNAIGAISPPMGTLMFVTCSITKCKTAAFIKEAVPFYVLLIINLLLLTWFAPFTTFLVDLFY